MAETKTIDLGAIKYTDRGEWASGYTFTDDYGTSRTGYLEKDVVEHNNSVYSSLADDNTVEPGTDETKWRLWVNGQTALDAASAANTAAETANKAAARTEDIDNHPNKMLDNGNWGIWNYDTQEYEDSGVSAAIIYPTFERVGNKLYLHDYTTTLAERVEKVGNKLYINV